MSSSISLRLGILDFLCSSPEGAYIPRIKDELSKKMNKNLPIGSVTTTLDRLNKQGLVVLDRGKPSERLRSRPRAYYIITEAGKDDIRNYLSSYTSYPGILKFNV